MSDGLKPRARILRRDLRCLEQRSKLWLGSVLRCAMEPATKVVAPQGGRLRCVRAQVISEFPAVLDQDLPPPKGSTLHAACCTADPSPSSRGSLMSARPLHKLETGSGNTSHQFTQSHELEIPPPPSFSPPDPARHPWFPNPRIPRPQRCARSPIILLQSMRGNVPRKTDLSNEDPKKETQNVRTSRGEGSLR